MFDVSRPLSRVKQGSSKVKTQLQARATRFINRRPLLSFLVFLTLLVALIALGNQLRQPATEDTKPEPVAKTVQIFDTTQAPTITIQAQVEKSGIIRLVAQTGGIVQQVRVREGDRVKRGTQVLSLSSNYLGGNVMSISRQISQRSYQFQQDTYNNQKATIATNRELANRGETQQAQLRQIARDSLADTRTLISLNEDMLEQIESQITALEAQPTSPTNEQTLMTLRSSRIQVLSALVNLRSGLRNAEYLNDDEKDAAEMAHLTRDATLKQLELQEQSLELNKDLAALNLRIAQINESLMFPASPCAGVVERVYVQVGQSVSPGTVLATIKADTSSAEAVALLSADIARSLSPLAEGTVEINDQSLVLPMRYISQDATDGSLHAAYFTLPEEFAALTANTSYLNIRIPVGMVLTSGSLSYAPLDAVYQGQASSHVYVAEDIDGRLQAVSRQVTLGQVFGNYVEIKDGLQAGDKVIINRNIIEGDVVNIQ